MPKSSAPNACQRHEPLEPHDAATISGPTESYHPAQLVVREPRLVAGDGDLQNLVLELLETFAHLKATELPVDTSTPARKAFLDMIRVFAEFETNLRRERQMEWIAAAKTRGVYKGQPKAIQVDKVRRFLDEGMGATQVAQLLGIGRPSVYRVIRGSK